MKNFIKTLFGVSLCIFSGCVNSSGDKNNHPLIIGHRGASGVAPENTVASVSLAFDMQADGAEIDVYLTENKKIVAIHDSNTKRTTGVSLSIAATHSDVIRELDAGSWKSQEYEGEKIPFLQEIIDIVPAGKHLFVEVKCGKKIVPYLKDNLVSSDMIEQITILSFDADVLIEAKKMLPDVPMFWIKGSARDKDTNEFIAYDDSVIEFVVDNGLEGLALNYNSLTKEFVDKAKLAGLEVNVWTVNSVQDADRVAAYGVGSITTNYPDKIRKGILGDVENLR